MTTVDLQTTRPSRLASKKAVARRCCRRWIWWANSNSLAKHTGGEFARECESLSTRQLVARIHALPSIQPYALLSTWSYLYRAVRLCDDSQIAPTTIFLSGQLMAAFKSASHGQELGSFMHKFRYENGALTLYGWQEAFLEMDPQQFDLAVKSCARFWPRSLLVFLLSML
jgi:hypothetical protein